ncbi:MAG: flagellar assembly protein FliW [Deltaproteobacteria bacterium]|nr:flagellar assembly protein FliW [Deltaproteobacteria bacterium]
MNLQQNVRPLINFATSRFGPLSVTEDKIINFVNGIPGFERLRRFILIDHDPEGLFKWLQAVDDPSTAFLLTNPNLFKSDYTAPLRKPEMECLGARDEKSIVIFVMVCVSTTDKKISLNLKGPVVFNAANMRAIQCIIDRDDYLSHFEVKI